MQGLSSTELIDLKNSLEKLVSQDRLSETEMLEILRKAGLARLPEGQGWIDESGARYYSH
jgi:hypothetical protein